MENSNSNLLREHFSSGKKHYFLDFRQAQNNTHFIHIRRRDLQEDLSYKETGVVVFEEDFEFLIAAFSSLFQSASRQEWKKDVMNSKAVSPDVKGIKSWEPELRPRERLISEGQAALEDKELLAILIGSGTPRQTAVDLAERILHSVGNDLDKLSTLTVEDLCRFKGMGHARSASILSAMALADRRFNQLGRAVKMRMLGTG